MSPFCSRVREERKRLKKNQKEMAALLGMADRTYWDREAGAVVPDAEFLARFREVGGDVWYVITGERMAFGAAQERSPYSPAERAAAVICGLLLSEADAELLTTLARRLAGGQG